jgi:hypothetical protein
MIDLDLNLDWRLSRQAQMVNRRVSELRVCIVGCGGIGSNAAHLFASMGVMTLTLFDPDEVAEENIHPGWFTQDDADDHVLKVDAILDGLEMTYGITPTVHPYAVGEIPEQSYEVGDFDIVLVGTDSLHSRQEAWDVLHTKTRWWMDGRMGGPGCDLYVLRVDDTEKAVEYERTLRSPEGMLPCGMKATAFITKGYLMGMIGDALRDIVNRAPVVPYRFRYDADDKMFLVETGVRGEHNWLSYRMNQNREGGDEELSANGNE